MPVAERISPGFDTSLPGTPEAEWSAWVADLPAWWPNSGELVVVAPHPDDEILGAGGLIATLASRATRITILSVTDGEAACPEIPALASVRRAELKSALGALGAADVRVVRLGLPDGAVSSHTARLEEHIQPWVSRGTTLVAPVEYDGHPDHEAVGRACVAIASRSSLCLARYAIWAWFRGHCRVRAEPRAVRFPLSPRIQRAKRRAITQFRSQLDERTDGAILPEHVLAYFRRPCEVFFL
jgi:LmbE family N-acetylglucosaminyl deacetylase